jgi:hypothetical protein
MLNATDQASPAIQRFRQYLTAARNAGIAAIESVGADREARLAVIDQLIAAEKAETATWITYHALSDYYGDPVPLPSSDPRPLPTADPVPVPIPSADPRPLPTATPADTEALDWLRTHTL